MRTLTARVVAGDDAELPPRDVATLRRYLPSGLAARLRDGEGGDWPNSAARDSAPAIVMIADISGYSKTAAWLQGRDRIGGAEQLSSCVNQYITEMVTIIAEYGGDVLHFAGDALICIWRLGGSDAAAAAAAAALSCAFTLVETLDAIEVLPGVSFSLHVGLDCGEAAEWRVGGESDGVNIWAHCLIFEQWQRLSLALDTARKGEVALSTTVRAALAPALALDLVLRPCGESGALAELFIASRDDEWPEDSHAAEAYAAVAGASSEAAARGRAATGADGASTRVQLFADPEADAAYARAIAGHTPPNVLLTLRQTRSLWIASTRQVSCVFLSLPQRAASEFGASHRTKLDRAFAKCVQTISSSGGTLRQFLVDDKGVVLIAVFGAPPKAAVDDAARALFAAVEMRSSVTAVYPDCAAEIAAGVCSGRAFCGNLGSSTRCEFTIVGDCVNMAARLMGKARKLHRGVLCDAGTREAHLLLTESRRASEFAQLVHIDDLAIEVDVKGRSAPIESFGVQMVRGVRSGSGSSTGSVSPRRNVSPRTARRTGAGGVGALRRKRALSHRLSFDVHSSGPAARGGVRFGAQAPPTAGVAGAAQRSSRGKGATKRRATFLPAASNLPAMYGRADELRSIAAKLQRVAAHRAESQRAEAAEKVELLGAAARALQKSADADDAARARVEELTGTYGGKDVRVIYELLQSATNVKRRSHLGIRYRKCADARAMLEWLVLQPFVLRAERAPLETDRGVAIEICRELQRQGAILYVFGGGELARGTFNDAEMYFRFALDDAAESPMTPKTPRTVGPGTPRGMKGKGGRGETKTAAQRRWGEARSAAFTPDR